MFLKSTYTYFKNYLFEIFYILSEYYNYLSIEDKRDIEMTENYSQKCDITDKQTVFENDTKTHKEICEMYVSECKKNKVLFSRLDEFVEKLTLYSKRHGAKNITKLNSRYIENQYRLLKFSLNKNFENIHLQSL